MNIIYIYLCVCVRIHNAYTHTPHTCCARFASCALVLSIEGTETYAAGVINPHSHILKRLKRMFDLLLTLEKKAL